VIGSFEQAGQSLAGLIPPDSTVYWSGEPVSVLLYLPGMHVYPAQLDGPYSFWLGGDDDDLERYGFWNDRLMEQWKQEADFFIIQKRYFTSEWQDFLDPAEYEELGVSNVPLSCAPDTYLRVFRRR